MRDVRWLGFDWGGHLYHASDYFEQLYEWAEQLIQEGKAYVDDLSGRADPRVPRHADRAGQGQPVPRPLGRGEPRPVPPDAGGRVPRRGADAAGEDRHGLAELQPARPGDVPHPARHAPPHRRQVVHLPDVRLGPRPVGLDRGHHALDLHAGVREPPAALRLVHRRARHLPPAADRVRPAEPDLHDDEQAQAARSWCREARRAAGTTRACRRSPACAAAATRRRRSASSASASA